jgi:glycosyltransferase involved in cell wall biosynthesis
VQIQQGKAPARRADHVAVTIVSNNYLSFARILHDSYTKHHPGHDFIIVLVDKKIPEYVEAIGGGLDIREMSEFRIPQAASFIYRYTIMELNTAVKPFVLNDLLTRSGYRTALYIDPDIQVFAPLEEVHKALESSAIALIPHMRRPYYDDMHPSDTSILQSGTYNLGFIGLRAGEAAARLLYWWMSKLYRDCIVDIPNGLFVDQKWIDLVPGFFPDHCIIHHPGYNAAYWNLHERPISRRGEAWFAGEAPLVFYHYSGFSPLEPHKLSIHQNRFQLEILPDLHALTDQYGQLLLAHGYLESSGWPYGFERLSNGVTLPLRPVRGVLQWAARRGMPVPDPFTSPDAFCRFLMSRGTLAGKPGVVLLFEFVLNGRSDVAGAFPGARRYSDDAGFRQWLRTSGITEERLGDILAFEDKNLIADYAADAFARLRRYNRTDVFSHFEDIWSNAESFSEFADWFTIHGVEEMNFDHIHTEKLKASRGGIGRILNIYFLRGDLQATYETLSSPGTVKEFSDWLRTQSDKLDLSAEEITLFEEFVASRGGLVDKMRFLYSHKGKRRLQSPNIFNVDDIKLVNRIDLETGLLTSWLIDEPAYPPADHFGANFGSAKPAEVSSSRLAINGVSARQHYQFIESIAKAAAAGERPTPLVNLAAYLTAPTGMGESGRSMRATLASANLDCRPFTLPHPRAQSAFPPVSPMLFGWPAFGADVSITVANADSKGVIEAVMPPHYWARKNIGYWVWETERLPAAFRDAQDLFDEVWTPSSYSAEAIGRTIDRPVRVVPHTLDFHALRAAKPDREQFGLPENATLFGFVFDPQSFLERKNIGGLIDAFDSAMRPDDNCYLVLKLNGRNLGTFEYEMLRVQSGNGRILFVEGTLSRTDSFAFIKSLDVYVSLHRAEGFGLTCAEAMAMEVPVIATGYSGNLQFMDAKNSLLVPASVIETGRPYGSYPAGTRWGDPDVAVAAEMMRSLLDAGARKELGAKARKSVRRKLDTALLGRLVLATMNGKLN